MSTNRQIPLFQPQSVDDLTQFTELQHTISLFQDFLLKEGKSEHTVKAFTSDLQLLAERAGDDTPVGEFTTETLNDFLQWLENGRGVPCSRKSYARRVTTLKVYFKWLHGLQVLPIDPAAPVLQRSGPAPLARILSPAEITEALAYARSLRSGEKPDARPETLFRLVLDTGIKKGETVALKREHIDRTSAEHPILTIKHKVRNVYKERKIELDAAWLRLLDEYLMQYSPKNDLIFDCTARNLEYVLADIAEGAELPKISFEMLRWTCAVRDYRAGIEPEAIRDALLRQVTAPVRWVESLRRMVAEVGLSYEAGIAGSRVSGAPGSGGRRLKSGGNTSGGRESTCISSGDFFVPTPSADFTCPQPASIARHAAAATSDRITDQSDPISVTSFPSLPSRPGAILRRRNRTPAKPPPT